MLGFFILLLTIAVAAGLVSPQSAADCPAISVSGPAGLSTPGDTVLLYKAYVEPKEGLNLKYNWTISAGEIVGGQGTDSLHIRFPKTGATVTVEIDGLPTDCAKTASEGFIWDPPEMPKKIGVLRSLKVGSYEPELTRFIDEIFANPDSQAYIFIGHSKTATRNQIGARERIVSDALSNGPRPIDKARIMIVRHQPTAEIVEFWLVPPGANNPSCEDCGIKPKGSN